MATRKFASGEIIVDYHGKKITKVEAQAIRNTNDSNDRRSDYMFEFPNHQLFYDGSTEMCECHPHTRTMGRLINYAAKGEKSCNVTARYFNQKNVQTIIFVASRDIPVFEELMYDYSDSTCAEIFGN